MSNSFNGTVRTELFDICLAYLQRSVAPCGAIFVYAFSKTNMAPQPRLNSKRGKRMRNHKNNITLSSENIISFSRNITSHFTGKEKIITLVLVIIMLSFINTTFTSALSYQSNVGVGFTFNPTLSVSISPSNLVIDNLTPSITADSNAITVSVATNAAYGYTLSATVNGDNNCNNSNLTHANGTSVFSSIATDASLSSLTNDNTWGYSYKNNIASTPAWSNYSGLSNEVGKVLFNTDSNSNGSIDFKIAAKASNTQPSGAYTGTINFTAVTKPMPTTIQDIAYMQTFGELDELNLASVKGSMIMGTTYTLKDARDEQEYTIAKLADGKIWMTKNLNLAGGTTLSPDDTDFESSYTLPTTNGWTTTDNNSKLIMPTSSTSGFSTNNYAYLYNSNSTTCANNSPCYSYYSWDTATLGSGRSISADNTNAPYSICSKGWHLPSTYNGINDSADFRALIIAYGGSNEIQKYTSASSPTGASIYNAIGPGTSPNFLLSGYYDSSLFNNGGSRGAYWTATSSSGSYRTMSLRFYGTYVDSADIRNRNPGYSVRCLAR